MIDFEAGKFNFFVNSVVLAKGAFKRGSTTFCKFCTTLGEVFELFINSVVPKNIINQVRLGEKYGKYNF